MTREEADFIGGMNMCDEISNEAYRKIMCHCEDQESILNKIRAEIEQWHKEGTNWSDIRLIKIEDILDKYIAESEN